MNHAGLTHIGLGATERLTMRGAQRSKRRITTLSAVCALAIGLGACATTPDLDMYDPASGATKKDFEGLVGRRGQDKVDAAKAGEAPPIPQFQSVLAAPSAPELADTRRVSLSVTETTPVRDIIIELARKAEVDLELDPRIAGGVVMSVTDRPFIDVIERLTDLAELRFKFEKNVLRVELDDPYLEQYRMDVLNQTRSSTGSISSSTDASSASQVVGAGGGGGGGGNNKSDSQVSSSSTNDFWLAIGQNVGDILNNIQSRRGAAGKEIQASFVAPVEEGDDKEDDSKEKKSSRDGLVAKAGALTQGRQEALDDLVAQDQGKSGSDSDEDEGDGKRTLAAGGGGGGGGGDTGRTNFSVNAQAGIITVFANKRQHAAIDRYLRSVRNSVMQQVLIEAKILEITLNDQYRAGINWQGFLGPNNDLGFTTNFSRNVVVGDTGTPTIGVTWENSDQDLSIAAQLVKQFGTVRTLSSPRLTVLNNQTAILKVAQNQIFFDLQVDREENLQTNRTTITVESEIKSIPVGLIMNVQPAVDPTTKRINMALRPSVTRITGYVADPGVAIQVAQINAENNTGINVSSQIPIVEVRELDSMITMDSGQTVVMGGLMQESSENTREGVPGAMDVPILGQAVSSNVRGSKVTELVIFIRATVVNDRDTIADEDIRLYKTFVPDPRAIAF